MNPTGRYRLTGKVDNMRFRGANERERDRERETSKIRCDP